MITPLLFMLFSTESLMHAIPRHLRQRLSLIPASCIIWQHSGTKQCLCIKYSSRFIPSKLPREVNNFQREGGQR